jgi:HK97 family phage major capsid protein
MTNAKVVGALKKLKSTTGQYLWTNAPGGQRGATPGEINGYTVARTNQVPSNLTKGTGTNLSAVYYGNWSDILIAEWGSMEILLNPYGAGFKSGTLEMRALQAVDVNIRHAASFAVKSDAIA